MSPWLCTDAAQNHSAGSPYPPGVNLPFVPNLAKPGSVQPVPGAEMGWTDSVFGTGAALQLPAATNFSCEPGFVYQERVTVTQSWSWDV